VKWRNLESDIDHRQNSSTSIITIVTIITIVSIIALSSTAIFFIFSLSQPSSNTASLEEVSMAIKLTAFERCDRSNAFPNHNTTCVVVSVAFKLMTLQPSQSPEKVRYEFVGEPELPQNLSFHHSQLFRNEVDPNYYLAADRENVIVKLRKVEQITQSGLIKGV
jgi:hypothetical protein